MSYNDGNRFERRASPSSFFATGDSRIRTSQLSLEGSAVIRITISRTLRALTVSTVTMGVLFATVLSPVAFSYADVLELKNGGRVDGILLNPKEDPRTKYVMRLEAGGSITIALDQVKTHVALSQAQKIYQRNLKKMPATAEANWRMADELCAKYGLRNERKLHLEAAIQLDPEHAKARDALGYFRRNGIWTTREAFKNAREEFNKQRGMELHEGRWRFPQDVEMDKNRRAADLARKKWAKDIKRWRGWLGKKKDQEGFAALKAIKNPLAAPALAKALEKEQLTRARYLYVNALGKMSGPVATEALVKVVLEPLDPTDLDLRDKALDGLARNDRDLAVDAFIHALGSKDNAKINRAAFGLQQMPESRAVRPLIDALQTKHTYKPKSNPGQISTSFGSGGTGLSTGGGGAKTVTKILSNRDVLDALLKQSEGFDFQYNQVAWRNWYATRDIPHVVDLRRRP